MVIKSAVSVTDTVWPWTSAGTPESRGGNPRIRALMRALIAAAAGALLSWRGHRVLAGVLAAVAAGTVVIGVCFPRGFLAVERLGRRFGLVVGTALTWLLLTPLFFLVFFPTRIVLALLRRDPMCRSFPTRRATYWSPRPPVQGPEHYLRQY